MTVRIINYAEVAARFDLKPEEAIKFFQEKGLRETFDWRDMIGEEHDADFTVAKMMDTDLLQTVQERLNKAIADGTTLKEFTKDLIPELQKAGWWGKKDVVDPLTGKVVNSQLGSASRLENIFRTNLQSAYSVGRWNMIQRNAITAPYLMYDAVDDSRTRSAHAEWDNTVLPVTNAFWDEWMPPNGYNCRCGTIQLSADDLEDYGLKVSPMPKIKREVWTNPRTGRSRSVPQGIDPGWDQNPGKRRLDNLKNIADEKTKLLPPEQAAAVKKTPKPPRPDLELTSTLTLDDAKKRGKIRLDQLMNEPMSTGEFAGRPRQAVLEYFADKLGAPGVEEWAQDFNESLLAKLSAARSIKTPAKVVGTGKGAKAIRDASKRYPDDWTAAADKLGPVHVKYSTKRGYQVTLSQNTPYIQDFGWAHKKLPAQDGKPAVWPKGTGFIVTDDSSTAVHEYAHRLQYALAALDEFFNEEHRRRTKGDPLKSLRSLTGLRYAATEKTREDGYYNPYMGKEYSFAPDGRPAMEVMTMTFEPLLGEASAANSRRLVKLLLVDPEMARLAIGLLFHYKHEVTE